MFRHLTHNVCSCFLVALALLFTANPLTVSAAKASSSLEFAEKVFRTGKDFNCRARGWFTGYSGDTNFSFYGSYIAIMPSPGRYNSTTKVFSFEFEEPYHIIKVIRREKYKIIGQLFSPLLASEGFTSLYGTVELETYIGGEIRLIVSHEGNSKLTEFSCQDEIDDMF